MSGVADLAITAGGRVLAVRTSNPPLATPPKLSNALTRCREAASLRVAYRDAVLAGELGKAHEIASVMLFDLECSLSREAIGRGHSNVEVLAAEKYGEEHADSVLTDLGARRVVFAGIAKKAGGR